MGRNGVGAILRLAKLGHLIGNYPPDRVDREFPFEDFAAINQAIEDIYGRVGAIGLCVGAGRATFRNILNEGPVPNVPEVALRSLPMRARIKAGLVTVAATISSLGGEVTCVEQNEDALVVVVQRCPICWGRISDRPICYPMIGMLEEALHWSSDSQDFSVVETECIAMGDDACRFAIGGSVAH